MVQVTTDLHLCLELRLSLCTAVQGDSKTRRDSDEFKDLFIKITLVEFENTFVGKNRHKPSFSALRACVQTMTARNL